MFLFVTRSTSIIYNSYFVRLYEIIWSLPIRIMQTKTCKFFCFNFKWKWPIKSVTQENNQQINNGTNSKWRTQKMTKIGIKTKSVLWRRHNANKHVNLTLATINYSKLSLIPTVQKCYYSNPQNKWILPVTKT